MTMRNFVLFLPATLLLAACSEETAADPPIRMAVSTAANESDGGGHGEHRKFSGPGYICGLSFALELHDHETAETNDPGVDFVTYRVATDRSSFVLCEGNFPQEAGRVVQTGEDFPAVIAVHLPPESAQSDAENIERRLLLGSRQDEICGNESDAKAGPEDPGGRI